MSDNLKLCIKDALYCLIEKAETMKKNKLNADDYESGKHFGYYEAISILDQCFDAFQINKKEFGLQNFNIDDLL